MLIVNNTAQTAEAKTGGPGSGGGPDGWRTLGPGQQLTLDLPPNTMWQVECRLAGSLISSTLIARSDAEIQLVLSGARIRPVLDKEPIQV